MLSKLNIQITILLTVSIFLCLSYFGMRNIILSSFASLEQEEMIEEVERTRNLISSEIQELARTAGDYAGWNDTYRFVQQDDPKFVKTNFTPESARKLRLNMVLLADANGNILYGSCFNGKASEGIPPSPGILAHFATGSRLLTHPSPESSINGLLQLPEGVMMIASRPVLNSDFSGPVKGTLVFGRYLDSAAIRRLSEIVELNISFDMGHPPLVPSKTTHRLPSGELVDISTADNDKIVSAAVLRDVYGASAGAIQVTKPRRIYLEGKSTINTFFLLTALITTVFSFMLIHYITMRKQAESLLRSSEERWKFAIEGAGDGIWDWDILSGKVYYSNRLEEMLGYGQGEIGADLEQWSKLIHPDDTDRVRSDIDRYLKGKTVDYVNEQRLQCKNGRWKWILDRGMIIKRDPSGKPLRMIGTHSDITARKNAEEQLCVLNTELEERINERTQELERLNKELESFCYSISHELRAPIARLEGFSEVIRECVAEGNRDELAYLAERIGASSSRMRLVVDALLQMNRLSRTDLVKETINLSVLSRQILAELLEEAENRLKILITPNIFGQGDRYLISICMQNLLGNAVKYSAKTPEAMVEFGQSRHSGETVYFVRDNGAGFNMEFAHNLFKPFSRLHSDTEFEGNGIGLATVHRIIERHGGKIRAESEPGKGTTFYFTLE